MEALKNKLLEFNGIVPESLRLQDNQFDPLLSLGKSIYSDIFFGRRPLTFGNLSDDEKKFEVELGEHSKPTFFTHSGGKGTTRVSGIRSY